MKKSIYVSFINGKSENKVFKANEPWRVEADITAWVTKNHGKIRKINGVYLHDRYGNVVGYEKEA